MDGSYYWLASRRRRAVPAMGFAVGLLLIGLGVWLGTLAGQSRPGVPPAALVVAGCGVVLAVWTALLLLRSSLSLSLDESGIEVRGAGPECKISPIEIDAVWEAEVRGTSPVAACYSGLRWTAGGATRTLRVPGRSLLAAAQDFMPSWIERGAAMLEYMTAGGLEVPVPLSRGGDVVSGSSRSKFILGGVFSGLGAAGAVAALAFGGGEIWLLVPPLAVLVMGLVVLVHGRLKPVRKVSQLVLGAGYLRLDGEIIQFSRLRGVQVQERGADNPFCVLALEPVEGPTAQATLGAVRGRVVCAFLRGRVGQRP